MILFKNWKISANGKLLAMQYDNLSRELKVVGEIPEGYTWSAMVQAGELFDIILLEPQADGSLSSSLSAQQLSVSGDYIVQIKGVKDNIVRHTNQLAVFVGDSLSGDENWPEIPSAFTELEQRVSAAAAAAEKSAEVAENAQVNGPKISEHETWLLWDIEKGEYVDTGVLAQAKSGVYVGSGEMPDEYNVQIDPTGGATSAGKENAGNLLYVNPNGDWALLALGAGLKIENGVLMLDGMVVPGSTTSLLGEAVLGDMILGG